MRRRTNQRPVSCHFCRLRKLRCSRQFPCNNCTSRGLQCWRPEDPPPPIRRAAVEKKTAPKSVTGEVVATGDVLKRLERLEAMFAERFQEARSCSTQTRAELETSIETDRQPLPSKIQNFLSDALILEQHSLSYESNDCFFSNPIVFRTCSIRHITQAPSWVCPNPSIPSTALSIEPTKCIWLPERDETRMFAEKFRELSHAHYALLGPYYFRLIDEVYDDLKSATQARLGQILLILSINAHVTFLWTSYDCKDGHFTNASEAHSQSKIWVKAALDVHETCHRNSDVSLETTQALVVLSFVFWNMEGVSPRARKLTSMAITMGRELGLHAIDAPQTFTTTRRTRLTGVKAEVGRRLWWYLCGIDWLQSRQCGSLEGTYSINPEHMAVNKPQNIDDEDIIEGMEIVGKPLDQPTSMSYFLLRLRMAEFSRNVVDRTQFGGLTPKVIGFERVQQMSAELDEFWKGVPAFFHLNYDLSVLDAQKAKKIAVQRHVLNLFLNTQQCRFHLPYLARGAIDPKYAKSREICLRSTGLIIQAENKLSEDNPTFAHMRLRMTFVLDSAFIACIVLLLDACIDPEGVYKEQRAKDVAAAWKILQDAKDQSIPAAKLSELLSQVMKKHNVTLPTRHPETFQGASSTNEGNTTLLTPALTSESTDLSHETFAAISEALDQDWQCLESRVELDSTDWSNLLWGVF